MPSAVKNCRIYPLLLNPIAIKTLQHKKAQLHLNMNCAVGQDDKLDRLIQ